MWHGGRQEDPRRICVIGQKARLGIRGGRLNWPRRYRDYYDLDELPLRAVRRPGARGYELRYLPVGRLTMKHEN